MAPLPTLPSLRRAALLAIPLALPMTPSPSPGGAPRHAVAGGGATEAQVVEARLAAMTVREKAAQLVMPYVPGGLRPGTAAWRRAARLVAEGRVGGIIVGKGDRAATVRALARLQRASATPLLVAADLEWGAGMRLVGATLLPTAMAVAATGDTALAYAHGRATAAEARVAGIHVALAPALDVNVDPRNPVINTRSFGERPRTVAAFGRATVRGLQDGGLLAVVKHFPGHGDTDQDSHLTLPTIAASRARLDSVELVPFRAAIAAGTAGVMVGHIAVPALTGDRTPASLAPAVVDSLLRRRLGFDGLVMTDALNMAGAADAGSVRDVALRAVRAGADLLLQPADPMAAIAAIVDAVREGTVPESRLDASVRRILRAKLRAGLIGDGARAGRGATAVPPASRLADSIARRSLTMLRDSAAPRPLRRADTVLSLVYAGQGAARDANRSLEEALGRHGVRVRRRAVTVRTAATVVDSLLAAWGTTAPPGRVVVSVYRQALPWQGTTSLPAATAAAIERLARRTPVLLVAFGDPYVVAHVPSAAGVLLAWSGVPVAQRAVASALLGATAVGGRLPIAIPPGWAVGDGLTVDAAP